MMLLDRESSDLQSTEIAPLNGLREKASYISLIMIGGTLATPGTSSAESGRLWEQSSGFSAAATASDYPVALDDMIRFVQPEAIESTRKAVVELHRISGLTWEQVAELLGVSRRSVHFWASGKPLNASNEERLLRVLDVVRQADRGSASDTRAALLQPEDGVAPFERLKAQEFDAARAQLGSGIGRRQVSRQALSADEKARRAPLSPGDLVDAQHEPPPSRPTSSRGVRTARSKKGDGD